MDFAEKFIKSKIYKLAIKKIRKQNKSLTFINILNMMLLIREYCLEHNLTYDEFEKLNG